MRAKEVAHQPWRHQCHTRMSVAQGNAMGYDTEVERLAPRWCHGVVESESQRGRGGTRALMWGRGRHQRHEAWCGGA